MEVEGTRACNWERLVEPERESEEASVWALCLPPMPMGKEEKLLPHKGGGRPAERPPSWKRCHTPAEHREKAVVTAAAT